MKIMKQMTILIIMMRRRLVMTTITNLTISAPLAFNPGGDNEDDDDCNDDNDDNVNVNLAII